MGRGKTSAKRKRKRKKKEEDGEEWEEEEEEEEEDGGESGEDEQQEENYTDMDFAGWVKCRALCRVLWLYFKSHMHKASFRIVLVIVKVATFCAPLLVGGSYWLFLADNVGISV